MARVCVLLLALLCLLATCCHCTPIRVYEGTSGRKVFSPKPVKPKQVVPKPYRDPAPVWEVFDEPDYTPKKYYIYKPIKYGFVNPKTHRVFPQTDYRYNKRFIYTNYAHLNYV